MVSKDRALKNIEQPSKNSRLTNDDFAGLTFVQFSDELLTPESIMRDYYRRAYAQLDGYYYPRHFMEIPYWIPLISGMLSPETYQQSLYIVEDLDQAIDYLHARPATESLLFSVLDANVNQVHKVIQNVPNRAILGGYTNPADFSTYEHVRYLNSLGELPGVLKVTLGAPPNYRLFEGLKCIPRLSLSTGCEFKCAFCTVPTTLTLSSLGEIREQVDALRPLDFKLIFLDDKSFGQAKNWRSIHQVADQVRTYNDRFLGFIVQTPPSLALRNGLMEEAFALGVKYMELGVEIVDDDQLRLLNKPFRVHHLNEVCNRARQIALKIIPNIILGIPGVSYESTVEWIYENRDVIPVININFLAVHYGNERGTLPWNGLTTADRDQNSMEKSWLNTRDLMRMQAVMEEIYRITSP